MIKLREITAYLEEKFPLSYAEEYDNVGLLVGKTDKVVKNILICLDCTYETILEAINLNCNLIITHHPVIFSPVKSVADNSYIGKMIITAIENGISIYSAHTNLDSAPGGLTDYLASLLSLSAVGNMENNIGRILKAPKGYTAKDLILKLKEVFSTEKIYTTIKNNKEISTIALCNGSGADLIDAAESAKADVYISGDLKHHNILYLKEKDNLDYIEIRHYDAEYPMTKLIYSTLLEKFGDAAGLYISESSSPLIDADKIL